MAPIPPRGGYSAKVLSMEDADLRHQLIQFREQVIYSDTPSTNEFRKHCVLRRAMIDWLVANKPHDAAELVFGPPLYLTKNTDQAQVHRYGKQILGIIRRHQSLRVLRLRA